MQYLKEKVRERILKAAVGEFKENGYSSASIRNIAANAEISLGNVYRYFTNKEALYFAIINPFMEDIKRVIEREFVFDGRSMDEVSETLVKFLTKYSDELIIVRNGNSVHYEVFTKYIVDVTSRKVRELMESAYPDTAKKISNADFYDVIAESFLTALFKILRGSDTPEQQEKKCRELISFFFAKIDQRFASAE